MANVELLYDVKNLVESNELDGAMALILMGLDDEPSEPHLLNFLGYIYLVTGKDALAYYTFAYADLVKPDNKAVICNLGKAAHELSRYEEAIQLFLKAAQLDPDYAMAYANASASLVQMSQWDDAEKSALMALEIDPDEKNATQNLAHAYLAHGKWKEGWALFDKSLGDKFRKEYTYGKEKRWAGEKNQCVVVYGEQGLGDEVMYAQMIPELIKDSKKVIIDCDPKLANLFRRSFPKANVFGTRREMHPEWIKDAKIDARLPMGGLGTYYRLTDESFNGEAYLTPCKDRKTMWRALFDTWKKPVIGITTHGGNKKNNEFGRTLSIDDIKKLLDNTDYEFVSLDYKDELEHPRLRKYPFASQSSDYDDTAGLISACDLVFGMNTTAHHVAGALGIKTVTLVPKYHWWRYARPDFVMYKTQKLVHQNDRTWKQVAEGINLADHI